MGKPKLIATTQEGRRLRTLIGLLIHTPGHPEFGVMTETDIARRIGVHVSYVNKFKNLDRDRGVGSHIIRNIMKALKVDPKFFFDEAEPGKDLNVYILAEKRFEKAVLNHEGRITSHDDDIRVLKEQLDALKGEQRRPGPRPIKR